MSNLPIDLILIRHGESERNLIGKNNEIEFDEKEYKSIHSSKFRLTEEGKKQSIITGKYIKENISNNFDKYYTSDYIRTKETAALLNLENALWDCEFLIRERDNGVLSGLSNIEKELLYPDEIVRKKQNLFYFAPLGGESIANVCLRVEQFLSLLCKNAGGMKVIVVTHGHVLRAFRIRLEKMNHNEIEELYKEENKTILNTQIIWYSRKNPNSNKISNNFRYRKIVCPWNLEECNEDWITLKKNNLLSNQDLLDSIHDVKNIL
jgi:broad specificity phosphatase PhoE